MTNFRISAAAKVLAELDIGSVLDVGCRGCEARQVIPAGVRYFGNDLFQNETDEVDFVGDVMQMDFGQNFDCVMALDVVEHVDDPHSLMDKLIGLADRHVVVSLPNIFDLLHKYNFVFKSSLGSKYLFGVENSLDRHRWIMNCEEIRRFYAFYAEKHRLKLETRDILIGFDSDKLTNRMAARLISAVFGKNVMTRTIVGVFSR